MTRELKLNLPPVDDLFSTQEERDDAKLERVIELSLSEISDFPNHPFKVRLDDEMEQMTESVKKHGVLVPALIRPKGNGHEMIAGHRRKKASEFAGLGKMPCIVRNLTDDEATIIMVDSNLQREKILPSEKAFAYKMKLDAIKRQAGRPNKNNLRPLDTDLIGTRSDERLAESTNDSARQIQRYIRLTELIPSILQMVDDGKIAFRPAVELSYLSAEHQESLFETMECEDCTPSLAQSIKMKQFSQDGRLNEDVIFSILSEEKPNQKESFKIPQERISKYFSPGTPAQKIEDTIIKALELYRKRERAAER